jgi:hypothetical protein
MPSFPGKGHPRTQARSAASSDEMRPDGRFAGFRSLAANFTQVPNEIWSLKIPGLTATLRWTLVALTRETVGEAYRRGGSPYGFTPITWSRWMELLDVQERNTVRSRLATLEAMALIEVLPGTRGPWGTRANSYRLRWVDDGEHPPRTFKAVLQRRQREAERKREGRRPESGPLEEGRVTAHLPPTSVVGPAHPPEPLGGALAQPPRRTPGGGMEAHPSSSEETMYKKSTEENPSIRPSVLVGGNSSEERQDRSMDGTLGVCLNGFDARPWLKRESPGAWPEPILNKLKEILGAGQIVGLERRSPWNSEGAWAILQGTLAMGPNLGNKPGTLWNALAHVGKGIARLETAGPLLRDLGWQMEPEDGTPAASLMRVLGERRLAREGLARMPLHGAALERHRRLLATTRNREHEIELGYGLED